MQDFSISLSSGGESDESLLCWRARLKLKGREGGKKMYTRHNKNQSSSSSSSSSSRSAPEPSRDEMEARLATSTSGWVAQSCAWLLLLRPAMMSQTELPFPTESPRFSPPNPLGLFCIRGTNDEEEVTREENAAKMTNFTSFLELILDIFLEVVPKFNTTVFITGVNYVIISCYFVSSTCPLGA